MAAGADDDNLEGSAAGHDGAGAGADGAARGLRVGPVVQGEGSFDGGSHVGEAVLEHASRAGAALLCGLEGEVHRAAEGGLAGFEHAGGAEEHGGVAVVAAGVHLAGDAAAAILGHVGFLRQRQRVHVRAEEHDGGAPLPIVARTPGEESSSNATPIAASSRFTTAEVAVSVHISSGVRWSSRRMPTT